MNSRPGRRKTGNLGEEAVSRYLEQKGAEILCRNFTVRGGEIDIIARLEDLLLFVEVKTRRAGGAESGAMAVDMRKQKLIIRTATQYLLKFPSDLQPRFDVAAVEYSGNYVQHIEYLEGAFDASDY